MAGHPGDIFKGATIAFDLDGTLVDTAPDLVGTLNAVLIERGHRALALETARPMIGGGALVLLQRGFAAVGAPLAADAEPEAFARFLELYVARIAEESRPFPGVVDTLDELAGAGATLVVCTNKRTPLSKALLEALDLAGRFAAIVGPDAAGATKPDPRHLVAAVQAGGGVIERALLVGNSAADVAAARGADAPVVAVSFGYAGMAPANLGADALIDRFDQLTPVASRLLDARTGAISPHLSGRGALPTPEPRPADA